jgi:hypothetical protein
MREDDGFEIDRAFDLLPHVIGASWATIWFRTNHIRRPTREEFRSKVVEYYKMLEPLVNAYSQDENFKEMTAHIRNRNHQEIERILAGKNDEIERRYKRYVEYR